MRPLTTRSEEDDFEIMESFMSIAVIEEDQPEPTDTGLLDSDGKPIYRIPVEKPPIGFITDPDLAELYNCDPSVDFYYSTDE